MNLLQSIQRYRAAGSVIAVRLFVVLGALAIENQEMVLKEWLGDNILIHETKAGAKDAKDAKYVEVELGEPFQNLLLQISFLPLTSIPPSTIWATNDPIVFLIDISNPHSGWSVARWCCREWKRRSPHHSYCFFGLKTILTEQDTINLPLNPLLYLGWEFTSATKGTNQWLSTLLSCSTTMKKGGISAANATKWTV